MVITRSFTPWIPAPSILSLKPFSQCRTSANQTSIAFLLRYGIQSCCCSDTRRATWKGYPRAPLGKVHQRPFCEEHSLYYILYVVFSSFIDSHTLSCILPLLFDHFYWALWKAPPLKLPISLTRVLVGSWASRLSLALVGNNQPWHQWLGSVQSQAQRHSV